LARYKIAFLIFRHLADTSALTAAVIRHYDIGTRSAPDHAVQLRKLSNMKPLAQLISFILSAVTVLTTPELPSNG
jgi:hypothetical protein